MNIPFTVTIFMFSDDLTNYTKIVQLLSVEMELKELQHQTIMQGMLTFKFIFQLPALI